MPRRERVLVLRPGALGDTLLAVPALRALRRRFPGGRLTLAAHGPTARLLEIVGEVDRGVPFDHPSLGWLFDPSRRLDPDESPTAVVAWVNGPASDFLGRLRTAGAGRVLVAPSRPDEHAGVHCARHLVNTLEEWGVPMSLDDRPLCVTPQPADEVLVHPGSGSVRKNWPPCRFAATIREFLEHGVMVRLVVGDADCEPAAATERALGKRLPHLEQSNLSELAAWLAGCRAYLGNDSGVSHLAGLVGARTVALFGPTAPATWAPLGPRVRTFPFEVHVARVVETLL
jgi:ADP-heptose:LPS heptosyltransferase